jgi:transcriptional regulator with XRE-family HTH domain
MKSKEVGNRIAKILKDNRYSQRKFAEEVNMPQSVISEIINGNREVDKLVNIVSDKFGISRDYLITGVEANRNDMIASDSISANGLTKEEKLRLVANLEELYRKHQSLLDDASQVMKEIAAINKILIMA